MSEEKEKRFRLVICIGDGEDTITVNNLSEEELNAILSIAVAGCWVQVKDWLGTHYVINPEWISHMYWREMEAEEP